MRRNTDCPAAGQCVIDVLTHAQSASALKSNMHFCKTTDESQQQHTSTFSGGSSLSCFCCEGLEQLQRSHNQFAGVSTCAIQKWMPRTLVQEPTHHLIHAALVHQRVAQQWQPQLTPCQSPQHLSARTAAGWV